MQVKLLRALQEGEIRRVGASGSMARIDTRIVAATNRNLEKEVKDGSFREDLFYRLSVVTLRVPPLRERRTDIPLLANRFLRLASERVERGPFRFTEGTVRTLVAYDWPGNVRELESAVEHAVLRARGIEITPDDLPAKLQAPGVRGAAQSSLKALMLICPRSLNLSDVIWSTSSIVWGATARVPQKLWESIDVPSIAWLRGME